MIIKPYKVFIQKVCLMVMLLACSLVSEGLGQPMKNGVTVADGKVFLTLHRNTMDIELKDIQYKYDLEELPIKKWLTTSEEVDCAKYGWHIEVENKDWLVISRSLETIGDMSGLEKKLLLAKEHLPGAELYPVGVFRKEFGFNSLRQPGAVVTSAQGAAIFLDGFKNARDVRIAGSFTRWENDAIPMKKNSDGWYINLKLDPGKHFYKFIVDGNWYVHKENINKENDGKGNINSVLYIPNHSFRLAGYQKATRVFVAGSFNGWAPTEAALKKVGNGWELPVYLPEGTHSYRFVVDGEWMEDPGNAEKVKNEFGEYNSSISLGKPFVFRLDGFRNAKSVFLVGSFNGWRENNLNMQPRNNGWEIAFTPGSGNHEYYFVVDGYRVGRKPSDAEATLKKEFLNFNEVIGGNYTFVLKGFKSAGVVYLSGSFNNWSKNGFPMKLVNGEWQLKVNLPPGKQTYKFIVDGKWMLDPGNKLWEQNEHNTKNSVLWIDPF